ncbi:MAG: PEP-utilizing enzyme [Tissierellales bacterium]|nr:PEP-utilizing enzyme [Tissierellales bacterium]
MNGYQQLKKMGERLKSMTLSNFGELTEYVSTTNWDFASKNEDDDFHTDLLFLRTASQEMEEYIGDSHEDVFLNYNGYCGSFYFEKSNSKRICENIKNKLREDENFRKAFNKNIYEVADKLASVYGDIDRSDFKFMGKAQLKSIYERQMNAQIELYRKCWPAEVIQIPEIGLEEDLIDEIKKWGYGKKAAEQVFYELVRCDKDSVYVEEEKLVMDLAKNVLSNDEVKRWFDLPIKHLRTHCPHWLSKKIEEVRAFYGYLGYHGFGDREMTSTDEYLKRIKEYVNDESKFKSESSNWNDRDVNLSDSAKHMLKIMTNVDRDLVKLYGELAVSKAYRRLAQLKNFYYLDELVKEIAYKTHLTESHIRFMMPEEVMALLEERLNVEEIKDIENRRENMVYIYHNNEEYVFTKERANSLQDIVENQEPIVETKVLKGRAACMGVRRGKAVIIERATDADKFTPGDILVSLEADPDLISVMRMAGAIVTDQGGITCHAAVIAREFNIPCVMGTKHATKLIKSGDMLLVDANKGEVIIEE